MAAAVSPLYPLPSHLMQGLPWGPLAGQGPLAVWQEIETGLNLGTGALASAASRVVQPGDTGLEDHYCLYPKQPSTWGDEYNVNHKKASRAASTKRNNGYVYVKLSSPSTLVHVHKVVCLLYHGEPQGDEVYHASHLCNHSWCLSPQHIMWCTSSENKLWGLMKKAQWYPSNTYKNRADSIHALSQAAQHFFQADLYQRRGVVRGSYPMHIPYRVEDMNRKQDMLCTCLALWHTHKKGPA